jgi:hypothetical protein
LHKGLGNENSPRVWLATADIYSDLSNPEWNINSRLINKLSRVWGQLKPYEGGIPKIPEAGYRGCLIKYSSETVWHTFDGKVIKLSNNIFEIKLDTNREFENQILRSASDEVFRAVVTHII